MFDEKIPLDDQRIEAYFEDCFRADLEHFSYWHERLGRSVRLSRYNAVFKVEGETIVSTCPELEITSQGGDIREALRNLERAVRSYLDTADPDEIERRYRKVYVTDFVVTHDPEYEEARFNDRVRIVREFADLEFSPEVVAKVHGFTVDEVNRIWGEYRRERSERRKLARRERARKSRDQGSGSQ